MNSDRRYTQFALVREMMQTPDILRRFNLKGTDSVVASIRQKGKLFLAGEGSSRIFPAKNAIYCARRAGYNLNLAAEGGLQACCYDLSDFVVFGASCSGQTKEDIRLFERLKNVGHKHLYALTANQNTKLESLANQTFILSCGVEEAVAATKSVAEQALFYQSLLAATQNIDLQKKFAALADAFNHCPYNVR